MRSVAAEPVTNQDVQGLPHSPVKNSTAHLIPTPCLHTPDVTLSMSTEHHAVSCDRDQMVPTADDDR